MKKMSRLLTAAIAGMVGAALAHTPAQAKGRAPGDDKKMEKKMGSDSNACKGMNGCSGEKNSCKGMNECKGKGGCKTDKHACKGMNECKGQGGCKS